MADLLSATIAAGQSSAEIPVTPLAPLGFQATKPCAVYAKNTGDGANKWGLIYASAADDDARILYPPSGTIKVTAGDVATKVQISDG